MHASPNHHTPLFTAAGAQLVRAGAVALMVGTVQFFIAHMLVERAWPEPYSWAQHNISDLGAVGCGPWAGAGRFVCSPLHAWMNTAFVLQGVLLITGLVLTRPVWQRFLTKTSFMFLLLAGLGWILAGVAPADLSENLHVLGAFLIFFCGNLGLIFTRDIAAPSASQPIRTFSRPLGALGLVATALFLGQIYLIFGMGGMERIAVFPLQVWAVLTGLALWRAVDQQHA